MATFPLLWKNMDLASILSSNATTTFGEEVRMGFGNIVSWGGGKVFRW